MAFPSSLPVTTVNTGPWLGDGGVGLQGRIVRLRPERAVFDDVSGTLVPAVDHDIVLDALGEGSTVVPSGIRYLVMYLFGFGVSAPEPQRILLPYDVPSVDLEKLITVVGADGQTIAIPAVTSVAGLSGSITLAQLVEALGGSFGTPDGSITPAKLAFDVATQAELNVVSSALAGKASPADVAAAVSALVNSAPSALDTLGELATALAADQSAVATLTTSLLAKAADSTVVHLAGAETIAGAKTFSSSPTVPTPTAPGHASPRSYVDGALAALVGTAPSTLDTLQEIAATLASDESAAAALTTAVAGKAALQRVATTVTAGGALAAGKHTPVDATTGPLTVTLPTGQAEGVIVSVEKTDSTANAVTVSGSLRGAAGTITLTLARESLVLLADSAGSWWPTAGHKTLSSLRAQTAADVADSSSATGVALRAAFGSVVSVLQFVQAGEHLVSDASSAGDNTAIIQRAVDALTAAWLVDGRPRQIYFPDGGYRLVKAGDENSTGTPLPYCVRWKSGVGIATGSRRGVIFYAPADATPFAAAKSYGNLSNVYCGPHVIDGAAQTWPSYTTRLKGWFIQGLTDSRFDDVKILNTWATGFGCDYLARVTVTGEADGCGRGIKEKAVDPRTTSGGSGFGIGTGRYAVEDFTLDVVARNCGFHGVFTESQTGEPYQFTKGSRIKALCIANYVGFRDCGSDGLVADITAVNNTLAGVLHDASVLAPSAGINGRLTVEASGSVNGILMGTANAGPYRLTGAVHHNTGVGLLAPSTAALADHTEISGLQAHHNGSDGVSIGCSTSNLVLHRIDGWSNNGRVLALRGADKTSSAVGITGCDVRDSGIAIEQVIAGNYRVASNRGLADYPAPALSVIADAFNGADLADITGRVAPDGSSAVAWETASTAAATYGITSGRGAATSGSVPVTALLNTGTTTGHAKVTYPVMKGSGSRRGALIVRWQDANNHVRADPNGGVWALTKLVAGAATALVTGATPVASADVVEIIYTPTSMALIVNGTTVGTSSDTAFVSSTKVGVQGVFVTDNVTRQDNFEWNSS